MTFDSKNSTFTRSGSFRHTTLTDRYTDPQEIKPGAGKYIGEVAPCWRGSLESFIVFEK